MKTLKIFIAIIALMFASELKAQTKKCFNMYVNAEQGYDMKGRHHTIVTVVIDNHTGAQVTVSDGTFRTAVFSSLGLSTVVWKYYTTPTSIFIEEIICESTGNCVREEGCVIVIDPT